MIEAIRHQARNVVAIVVLAMLAAVTSYVILQEQRLRIPIVDEVPFEFSAELEDAGSVVAGQGQTVNVAGVEVGQVSDVELEDGLAVVTFALEREFLPVYRDASILLRPRTGLEDMIFDLDPGTRASGELAEGGTLPVSQTSPDVELHEVLEALDADTQSYLRLLLVGGGKGLDDRGRDLGELLGSLGPINRDLDLLNREVASRDEDLARLIHTMNVLARTVGRADDDLAELITTSNTALGAIAEQDLNVRRTVRLLPGTLRETREALDEVTLFADGLGPTFDELRPFARELPDLNASTRELASAATPVIESEIRPFVRSAREPVRDLRPSARRLAEATPDLTVIGRKVNRLGNMAAYNPRGAEPAGAENRDEGYLYWLAWLSHNGNSVFESADAHGVYRRIYFTAGCDQIREIAASTPLSALVTGFDQLTGSGDACDPGGGS